jgi:hypothetical protein
MVGKFLFVVSLCFLAFLYGVGTVYLEIFPHSLLVQAKLAGDAWWEVLTDDVPHIAFVDEDGTPTPEFIRVNDAGGDDGYILVGGGPGAMMSECPEFGCLAWVMDRDGQVLHSWEVDLGALWADASNTGIIAHQRIAPAGMHLTEQGDLIAIFASRSLFPYGIGIAKFDKDGKLVWKRNNLSHHWLSVAPDGTIYTPAHRIVESPLRPGHLNAELECVKGDIYADVVLVLNPEGETVEEISVVDLLSQYDYLGTMYPSEDPCDPIHINTVEYVGVDGPGLKVGDLLVSARHLNMVWAIDGETRALKWGIAGRTIAQHSPRELPDGSILMFDNYGGDVRLGGSRVVRLRYGEEAIETVFPKPDADPGIDFFTDAAGYIDPSPDGSRALVSLTDQGRLFEIEVDSGKVLWEMVNTHQLGRFGPGGDDEVIGRLRTTGAWYVGRPEFLEDDTSPVSSGPSPAAP